MSVASEGEGRGCTFTVDLPGVMIEEEREEEKSNTHSGSQNYITKPEAEPSLRNMDLWRKSIPRGSGDVTPVMCDRLLLVDDSMITRKMMLRSLGDRFPHIDEALDGADALSKVRECLLEEDANMRYRAVLMDHQMPNMDGPTAARRMRELGYEGIIVGITGNAMKADIDLYLSRGADSVLSKPIDIAVLISMIDRDE